MRTLRYLLLLAGTVSLLAGCETTAAPEEITATPAEEKEYSIQGFKEAGIAQMNEAELKEFLVGKRREYRKGSLLVSHEPLPDGSLNMYLPAGKVSSKYWFEDDKYCLDSARGGTTCILYYQVEDEVVVCDERDGGFCDWELVK